MNLFVLFPLFVEINVSSFVSGSVLHCRMFCFSNTVSAGLLIKSTQILDYSKRKHIKVRKSLSYDQYSSTQLYNCSDFFKQSGHRYSIFSKYVLGNSYFFFLPCFLFTLNKFTSSQRLRYLLFSTYSTYYVGFPCFNFFSLLQGAGILFCIYLS